MKKVIARVSVLIVLLFVFLTIYSQNGKSKEKGKPNRMNKEMPSPAQRAEKFTERLKTDAGISDEQAAEIRVAQENFLTQRDEILKKYNGDRKAAQAELKPIKQQRQIAIKEILTPEQREKWKVAIQTRKGQKGGKGKKGRPTQALSPQETSDDDDDDIEGL